MKKMTGKQMAEAMDMMIRMQLMESMDISIKKMCEGYKSLDFRTMEIDKLKAISDGFESVVKAMEEI